MCSGFLVFRSAADKYKENAESNAFLRRVIYPARGLIYDREGRLVVFNQPAYDVMLIPKDVGDFDTVSLCKVLNITKEQLLEKWAEMKNPKKNPGYSAYTPQKLISHLSLRIMEDFRKSCICSPAFCSDKNCETI